MGDKSKKPKWLKRIKDLLKSEHDSDVDELIKVLVRLENKAAKLHSELALETEHKEKERLSDKLDLISKYRRKGLQRLKELLDQDAKE